MTKSVLMGSTALIMSPAERAMGRYMRAPDEHGGGAPAPAPAPAPTPEASPAPLASDHEVLEPRETTAEDLEAEFGGGEPATPETADVEDKPEGEDKTGAAVEERFAEITAARREAERQAAEARREADDLRAKLAAMKPPEGGDREGTDPDQAPDPAKYEFGEADARFIADTATFHARAEFQRQQSAAELNTQFADMEAKWQGEIAKPEVVEKYPDFDTVVTKAADAGEWDCSPLMAIGIKQSPVGADVAYHLATNKADASRIAKLSPMEQALEFGRLEGKYLYAPKASTEAPPVKTTAAPPPPGARARGAGGQFAVQADTDDFASFDKMADGLLSKKR